MTKPIIVSGIQPSGRLTLANYLGAIKHWVPLQDTADGFYVLVDLHAITTRQDPLTFADRCLDFVALYLACGIDPAKSTVFVQSHVPAHSELAWILACHTGMGALNRMTQFKDKTRRGEPNINAGLLTYPVLMAADILLYQATHVPVGDDQKQHLELARDLAEHVNQRHPGLFTVPEPSIPAVGARIMALGDPGSKMSKSDPNDHNLIALLDDPATIRNKIKRAVTDSGQTVRFDPDKPGVSNLLTTLGATTDRSVEELEREFSGRGYGHLKNALADAVIDLLAPVQARFREIRNDSQFLHTTLADGAVRAGERASVTMQRVRDALGLIASI